MRRAIKVSAAAIVIAALAGWYLWSLREGVSLASTDFAAASPDVAAKPKNSAKVEDTQSLSKRSAVVDAVAPADPGVVVESELDHPYLYMLVVRTLDEYGLPAANAPLMLGPVHSSLNSAQLMAEQAGSKTVIWRGKEPEMDVDVQYNSSDTMHGSRRVHLSAGRPCEVALLGESSVGERAVAGRPMSARLVRSNADQQGDLSFTIGTDSSAALSMSRFPHPHARFGDRFVQVHEEPATQTPVAEDQELMLSSAMRVIAGRLLLNTMELSFHRALLTKLQFDADQNPQAPDTSQVTLHVLDDHGEPAAHAMVALGREVDGTEQTTTTDEKGDAAFDSVDGGWWDVRAGGGAGGLARERLFVEAPNPLQWSARLDHGARVIGRVLDSEGNPALNMLVRYESVPGVVARSTTVSMTLETNGGEEVAEHGEARAFAPGELRVPWVEQTSPREDGTFEIANLPGGLGRLLVLDKDNPDGSALVVEEGVLAGEHEFILRLPADLATLRMRVQLPIALDIGSLEVRAIAESTGRGSVLHDDDDGGLTSFGLAPGWYRVEVGAGCFGWHDLGRQYVGPAAHVDLGTFTPPLPATIRVIPPAALAGEHPPLDLTFYLRRNDLDIRGEPRSLNGGEALYLPAGEYWMFWTTSDGTIHHKPMKLEAGARSELDLR